MASSETTEVPTEMPSDLPSELPFPPLTKSHILNCSFHSWYPQYRSITPKTRLIPLSAPFLAYLRADGIITPPDAPAARTNWSDSDSGIYSSADNDNSSTHSDESETVDPSEDWPEIHAAVRSTIQELGGKVVPKLNWSAPKDATWISPMNSLECRTPNDIYLLLKASDFVTHDLEHAFDDTVPDDKGPKAEDIPYHLVLRKHFLWNSSIEFRCFVRKRKIIGICQRDLNHYDFLFDMRDNLGRRIQEFFESKIKDTFPDDNFVLDVYVPPPYERVWLVDVNPWARRTDPLLFSWLELLTMPEPDAEAQRTEDDKDKEEEEDSEDDADEEIWIPEFRLVKKDDPEAYSFASPQYSAHKLPLEVVNAASGNPGNLAEFASQWQELLAKQQQQAEESSSDEE